MRRYREACIPRSLRPAIPLASRFRKQHPVRRRRRSPGLVQMNGRIYDPLRGWFLSTDMAVRSPGDLQAFDRYSQVLHNPLSRTDPTGFFFSETYAAAPPSATLSPRPATEPPSSSQHALPAGDQ